MIAHLSELIEKAREKKQKTVAVAAAHDREVLEAVIASKRQGLADSILIGDGRRIEELLRELGCEPKQFSIICAQSERACAAEAVRAVRRGEAQLLMKGLLSTGVLMREVVDREHGLRGKGLISHIMLLESKNYPKLLCLTDGGMNTFPTLEQKAQILENAARALKRIGYEKIYAACVCGAETVDEKIPATVDARELAGMRERWRSYDMEVYGPAGLDLAVSKRACEQKHYCAPGAGEADILLVPGYEMGNGIGKAMLYFGNAQNAGVIVGAAAPVILVSRADTAKSKLTSVALASLLCGEGERREAGTF